jgi:ubiquinone/menaquinone biosynthesis C-methylase UbiE
LRLCLACARSFDGGSLRCPICGAEPQTIGGFPAFAPEIAQATTGYDSALYALLAHAERDYFWFQARKRLIMWALNRYFPHAQSLLEIGCGSGDVLETIAAARPQMRVVGSEPLVEGLARAREHVGQSIMLLQMDARRLPYVEEFDVIGAFDVIEHIVEDEVVLAEMHRACHRGGGIILTVPQHRWLWSGTDEIAHHVRRYQAGDLRLKVEAAGFSLVCSTSFMTLLLPMLLAARFSPRKQAQNLGAELAIPRWLNRLLAATAALDHTLIKAGLDLPCGGSRLLVARKA